MLKFLGRGATLIQGAMSIPDSKVPVGLLITRLWNSRMQLKIEFCPQSDGVAICMLLANIYRAKINFLRGIRLVKTNLSSASAM